MADQPTVSFENDLAPLLKQFRGNMIWRFDLTSYDDVRKNYDAIFERIEKKGMPPPPYPPLTDEQIALFKEWGAQGFPR